MNERVGGYYVILIVLVSLFAFLQYNGEREIVGAPTEFGGTETEGILAVNVPAVLIDKSFVEGMYLKFSFYQFLSSDAGRAGPKLPTTLTFTNVNTGEEIVINDFAYNDGVHGDDEAGDKFFAHYLEIDDRLPIGEYDLEVFSRCESCLFKEYSSNVDGIRIVAPLTGLCEELYPGENDPSDPNRLNFIILLKNTDEDIEDILDEFKDSFDFYADKLNPGLFAHQPFRDLRDSFNIWYIPEIYIGSLGSFEYDDFFDDYMIARCPYSASYKVFYYGLKVVDGLTGKQIEGQSGSATVSLGGGRQVVLGTPYHLSHETGHMIGKLGDEYRGDICEYQINAANFYSMDASATQEDCERESTWSHLVGTGYHAKRDLLFFEPDDCFGTSRIRCDEITTSCYKYSCSVSPEPYPMWNPASNTIMGGANSKGFSSVDIVSLCSYLSEHLDVAGTICTELCMDGCPNGYLCRYGNCVSNGECSSGDTDNDGICNDIDNCVSISNSNQADLDDDGVGDVCDNDQDGDGFNAADECDDRNPSAYPGNQEICGNQIDDDCLNGDEICPPDCEDADQDGYGDHCTLGNDCNDDVSLDPPGCPSSPSECDALSALCAICQNPLATEYCDGIDNTCDGHIDSDGVESLYRDCGTYHGQCTVGKDYCVNGEWSGVCSDAIMPEDEYCLDGSIDCGVCVDGVDNDCNTFTDDCACRITSVYWEDARVPFGASTRMMLEIPYENGPYDLCGSLAYFNLHTYKIINDIEFYFQGPITNIPIHQGMLSFTPDAEFFCEDGACRTAQYFFEGQKTFSGPLFRSGNLVVDSPCDSDGDSYLIDTCAIPPGNELTVFDCDDTNANLYDGNGCVGICIVGEEICNGVDDDCDGEVDEVAPNCPAEQPHCSLGSCVACIDDASCDNGLFCDGQEICTPQGCVPGIVPDCSDGIDCTQDSCFELSQFIRENCIHPTLQCYCDDPTCDNDLDNVQKQFDPLDDNNFICGDSDGDGCDDCSVQGVFRPLDDGFDGDGDGICAVNDCDDTDGGRTFDCCVPTNNGVEICDGIDNDCDSTIDNGGDALCNGDFCVGAGGCFACLEDHHCDDFDDCTTNVCNSGVCSFSLIDIDTDNVCDLQDNCVGIANEGQLDCDLDNVGDVCDTESACSTDSDGDSFMDDIDNCPTVYNPGQEDNDFSTDVVLAGDACDLDDDNDEVEDLVDNCVFVANPGQENNDVFEETVLQGDACDSDDDNDGVLDTGDNCPFAYNPGQEDNDFSTDVVLAGDACDNDDDNDGDLDANDCAPFDALRYNGNTEVCTDGYDNNCNGVCDFDSSTCSHGDPDCRVGIDWIGVSATTATAFDSVYVTCALLDPARGVNSVRVIIDENFDGQLDSGDRECVWQDVWDQDGDPLSGWSSDLKTVTFIDCNVGDFGVKQIICMVDEARSYSVDQFGSQSEQITVIANACSDRDLGSCERFPDCEICTACEGSLSSGFGSNVCVPSGSCSHSCLAGSCGAECDGSVQCGATQCFDQCNGGSLIVKENVQNSCGVDCSCSSLSCVDSLTVDCGTQECGAMYANTLGSCANGCVEHGEGDDVCGSCTLVLGGNCLCSDGYYDVDGLEGNGCEYRCDLSNGGIELCDGVDNDCNGIVDDGGNDLCGGGIPICTGDFAGCVECVHFSDCDDEDPCTDNRCDGTDCEYSLVDDDIDFVCDLEDNCPLDSNPLQFDCDFDGIGDVCDTDSLCSTDTDGDGVFDDVDNCRFIFNPLQENFDESEELVFMGDACDEDDDNDGDPDVSDCDDFNKQVYNGGGEFCDDGIDNNCDNECDFDSVSCGHGDALCPVIFQTMEVSENVVVAYSTVDIMCQFLDPFYPFNSIIAYVDENDDGIFDPNDRECLWNDAWEIDNDPLTGWNEDFSQVRFVGCSVGDVGSKKVGCTYDGSKSYGLHSFNRDITVIAGECESRDLGTCALLGGCEICESCVGTMSNGLGGDVCVPQGSCGHSCRVGSCGAVCDGANGCPDTECFDQCNGNNIVRRTHVANSCTTQCGCEVLQCEIGAEESCGSTLCSDFFVNVEGSCDYSCVSNPREDATCVSCIPDFRNDCSCASGYYDVDGLESNGCEYRCDLSNGGVEICDDTDNNCDGLIDEIKKHFSDVNCNGAVDLEEVLDQIARWKSGPSTLEDVLSSLSAWKNQD